MELISLRILIEVGKATAKIYGLFASENFDALLMVAARFASPPALNKAEGLSSRPGDGSDVLDDYPH
jgi:hypothetical protein